MATGILGWRNGLGEVTEFEVRTVYDLFDVIQKKPGLFLPEQSLSALWWFYHGYTSALFAYKLEFEPSALDFRQFHDFVASHYSWYESTAGWRNIILKENNDNECKAFDAFFTLLAQFREQGLTTGCG
jgi:hypothetical protein